MPKLNPTQAKQAEEAERLEFELLPDGVYLASLNKVDEKAGKAGPYWEWEFLLEEDAEGNGLEFKPKLWENTSLSEKAIWRVAQMFEAFGMTPDSDTEECLGLYVYINVGHEVIDQGSKQGQLRNTFESAFPVPE